MSADVEYEADPSRTDLPETGILIRAKDANGTWLPVDLAHLSVQSAAAWLEREEGLATIVLLVLLGHPRTVVDKTIAELRTEKKETDLIPQGGFIMENSKGCVVAVMWNGAPHGPDWHYLDVNGDPFAENLEAAHIWPTRASALQQAAKWEEARIIDPRS
jgi:hypothetical protein